MFIVPCSMRISLEGSAHDAVPVNDAVQPTSDCHRRTEDTDILALDSDFGV
jgi:hypothetical protein